MPDGAFGIAGTGGAPAMGGPPPPPDVFPIMGADRSFVMVFFSDFPFVISLRSADYIRLASLKPVHRRI